MSSSKDTVTVTSFPLPVWSSEIEVVESVGVFPIGFLVSTANVFDESGLLITFPFESAAPLTSIVAVTSSSLSAIETVPVHVDALNELSVTVSGPPLTPVIWTVGVVDVSIVSENPTVTVC